MIITRIKVKDWRGIEAREVELKPGLNVLVGDNERGKSTILEALERALYWDSTARINRKKDDRLDYIAPRLNPAARPTVEVDLSGQGLEATIVKVVSAKRNVKSSHLSLRRGGREETYEGEEAEARIAELLSGDAELKELRVSNQSRSYKFVEEIPARSAAALSIKADGSIVPSDRLEWVRAKVGSERGSRLHAKLNAAIAQSAKANTPMAEARDRLFALHQQAEEARQELEKVDALRAEIRRLDSELSAEEPRVGEAGELLAARRERQQRQLKAEEEARSAQSERMGLEREAEKLEGVARELAQIESDLTRISREMEVSRSAVEEASQSRQKARDAEREAAERAAAAEHVRGEAAEKLDDARGLRELRRKERDLEHVRGKKDRLDTARGRLADAQKSLDVLGRWPRGEEIGKWRKAHQELVSLKQEAQTQLQLELQLDHPAELAWEADERSQTPIQAARGEVQRLSAVRSMRVMIRGVGSLSVRCGAEELGMLLDTIEKEQKKLSKFVAPFGVTVEELTSEGFTRLEDRRIAGEAAERSYAEEAGRMKELVRETGNAEELTDQIRELQSQTASLRTEFSKAAESGLANLDDEALTRRTLELAEHLKECEAEARRAQKSLESARESVRDADRDWSSRDVQLTTIRREAAEQTTRRRELEADGMSPTQRSALIHSRRLELAHSIAREKEAAEALERLGPRIADDELMGLEKNRDSLKERTSLKRERRERARGELGGLCGKDPQGRLDLALAEMPRAELALRVEERRMQALLLLDGLLKAEREKLARLISEPLNRRISGWLRHVRGLPTSVELSESGGRIERVVTQRGGKVEELPFEELSEGVKGQIALIVRLTLAQVLTEERGGPGFVILDDPLTETSPSRLTEMLRALSQAAQSLQVVYATCHHEALWGLSAGVHRIEV